jgi:hypothetical protein
MDSGHSTQELFMNSHIRLLFTVLTSTALMQGCFFFDALFYDEGTYDAYGYEDAYEPVEVGQGHLGGDFGAPTSSLPAGATGFTSGAWSSIELLSETDGEALMAIVDVWGGLESIPAGGIQTYDRYADGSEGHVSVVGCVGPEAFTWTRDEAADYVEIRATPAADDSERRTYHFRAYFVPTDYEASIGEGRSSVLTGRFAAP